MGFTATQAREALWATNFSGVEAAIEFLSRGWWKIFLQFVDKTNAINNETLRRSWTRWSCFSFPSSFWGAFSCVGPLGTEVKTHFQFSATSKHHVLCRMGTEKRRSNWTNPWSGRINGSYQRFQAFIGENRRRSTYNYTFNYRYHSWEQRKKLLSWENRFNPIEQKQTNIVIVLKHTWPSLERDMEDVYISLVCSIPKNLWL